jgi:hypothetical protein
MPRIRPALLGLLLAAAPALPRDDEGGERVDITGAYEDGAWALMHLGVTVGL